MPTKKTEKTDETAQVTEQPVAQAALPAKPSENEVRREALETLDELAQRHRVPAWQMGALLRYMGWEPDKLVTETDFTGALRLLVARPLGGGRL